MTNARNERNGHGGSGSSRSARVREILATTRGLVRRAERFVEDGGGDSRRFMPSYRPGPDAPTDFGEYRRPTNAKGWRKLHL